MDEANAEDLKDKLVKPLKIVDIAKWTLMGVGAAVFLAGFLLYVVKRRKSKETV